MATTIPSFEIDYTSFEEGDKVAEKKLDIALGQDEGKKKGKAAAPALKKGAIPMKAKGKGKNIKHAVKKATDKTTDPNATVALDAHLDQDDIVKQEKVKLDPLLQLEDDEEIDWDSDLDVDVILNREIDKDPYVTACEALNVVPVSFISQNLGNPELSIQYHGLGPRGSRALGKVLEKNNNITTLNLSHNGMDYGGKYFAKSMTLNQTITYVNLSNNKLKIAGSELAAMIAENSTLRILILSSNMIGDKEAVAIAEGLKQNQFLQGKIELIQALDLSHNDIGDIGGIALGQNLVGTDLRELSLGWNNLRTKGLQGLLNGCKDCHSMVSMNIAHNGIGDQANYLAEYLSRTQIARLDISFTRMSDTSFAPLLKGLEANRTLQELDISGNSFGTQSLQSLLKAIPMTKIVNLTMKHLRFTNEILAMVEGLKQEHTGLSITE